LLAAAPLPTLESAPTPEIFTRMMRRLTLAAAPLALFALIAACGGDSDDTEPGDGTPAADETSPADLTPVATPTDVPIPQPTPVPADFVVLQVVNSGEVFAPTREEFLALPQSSITHGGATYSGVSFAALAAEVGARDGAIITIEGTRSDNRRYGVIRFTLDEIGENTVLTISDAGHIDLASTFVPPEQWLFTVTGIAFD
jgi:hypothetical protein